MIGRLTTRSISVKLALFAVTLIARSGGVDAQTAERSITASGSKAQITRVVEMAQGISVEVSVVPMAVQPLIVVAFGLPKPPRGELSSENQALALDQALGQLERDKHLPPKFDFQPGSIRPTLLTLLQVRLLQPGANWDGRRGTSRRGDVYHSLSADVLAVATASPLAVAFAHHGYVLTSRGTVSRVEVGRVNGLGSAKLPIEIAEMGLVAAHIEAKK